MSEAKEVKTQEPVVLELGAGTVSRITRYIERRKAFDGTERSILFVAEEALDKGIDATVRSLENAKTLRGQREVDNWKANHPAPQLTLQDGKLNPVFVDYQRTLEALERKHGVGSYKPRE